MSRYQFPAQATTDASLLVSGTLADARLSSNVALENVANVFTAKQSFSGTSHAGLQLNSLTSVEYGLLTPANGDLFRDSTTDRIDARLDRGTVELIDTAGGQTINGALQLNGTLNLRNLSNPTVTLTWNGNDRSGSALLNGSIIQNNGPRPTFQTAASTLDGALPDFAAFNDNLTVQYFGLYKKSGTTGVMQVKSGPSTFASVELANLTASGTITNVPSSSVTLGTNGQFAVEMTSNTNGNLVYRGSDGVTRRAALTFV